MYQAALQLNGTSRNQYNSPGKSPTTDYIEVVSTVNRVNRKNQTTTIFFTEETMSLALVNDLAIKVVSKAQVKRRSN